MSTGAALDAARAVFAPSLSSSASRDPVQAPWCAEPLRFETAQLRGDAIWGAIEHVLRLATERADLAGQALVGAARQHHLLSLSDAHALVAMQGWADRMRDPEQAALASVTAPSEDERHLARDAWAALERAVQSSLPSVAAAVPSPAAVLVMSPPITTLAPSELPPAAVAPPAPPNRMPERTETDDHAAPRRSLSKRLAIGLLLIVAATALYFKSTAATREWNEAVASYTRGAKEAARLNFTRFATRHPDDARPRVYLGRIAREDQDYQTARQYLDTAVRLNPQSAMAQREMGSAMLAVNDPELARRFYVRALQLDDTDRPAMGFLGCALARLGRLDEARRWIERAGPGEWSECVTAPASTPDNAPLTTTRPTR